MSPEALPRFTCFNGHLRLVTGPLETVALAVKQAAERGAVGPLLIFDDSTGRSIDIDTRGSDQEVLARLATHPANITSTDGCAASEQPDDPVRATADSIDADAPATQPRGRGRPKLGVVAREVTLLPRHWDWLNAQPGSASVVLRKLVDEARRTHVEKDRRRSAQERAYHFMSAMAGDLPGFEEATRMLFANDPPRFRELVASWPEDVRDHAIALSFGADHDVRQTTLES